MAEQAKAQDEQPKDNKKTFIIIGAVLAAFAVGGGSMFLLGGNKAAKPAAQEAAKAEAGAAEGGHGAAKAGEGAASASNVYPLDPFIVNIYDGQEMRYLKLKVEFELSSSLAKAELDAKIAPLRDAILILLTTKTMQEIQDLQGKNSLREQILAAATKIAPSKVTKVYFTDFVVQ